MAAVETHAKFFGVAAKSAEPAFQIGEKVYNAKMGRDQGIFWKDFVKENFDFSVATANRHIRTYERLKDDPAVIREKTMAEINGGAERARREYNRLEEGGGAPAWDDVFSFEPVGGDSIWMYDRKTRMYGRAAAFTALEARRGRERARSLLLESVQGAIERYYAALEAMDGD
jgi:hypothetical protein